MKLSVLNRKKEKCQRQIEVLINKLELKVDYLTQINKDVQLLSGKNNNCYNELQNLKIHLEEDIKKLKDLLNKKETKLKNIQREILKLSTEEFNH